MYFLYVCMYICMFAFFVWIDVCMHVWMCVCMNECTLVLISTSLNVLHQYKWALDGRYTLYTSTNYVH